MGENNDILKSNKMDSGAYIDSTTKMPQLNKWFLWPKQINSVLEIPGKSYPDKCSVSRSRAYYTY